VEMSTFALDRCLWLLVYSNTNTFTCITRLHISIH
jgi:hypothetical protein